MQSSKGKCFGGIAARGTCGSGIEERTLPGVSRSVKFDDRERLEEKLSDPEDSRSESVIFERL